MQAEPRPWHWLTAGVQCGIGASIAVYSRLGGPELPAKAEAAVVVETPPPAAWDLDTPPAPAELAARIASWLALDPALSPYAERALGLRALLAVAPAEAVGDLADRLARRGGVDDARWFSIVFTRWIALDAAAATRWTGGLAASKQRLETEVWTKAREQAVTVWAKENFADAYAWSLGQPDASRTDGLTAKLLALLAKTDALRALSLAEARGPEAAAAALRPIFDAWAERDPESALRTLGPRLLKTDINIYDLTDSLKAWFRKSPAAALAWMNTNPKLVRFMEEGFTSRLVNDRDRDKSLAAIMELTDADLKYRMLRGLLTRSGSGDPAAVASQIDKLTDPDLRARLIRDANKVTYSSTERNLPFALLLPPGPERDARVIELTTKWAERDPVAALAWLKKHDEPAVALAVQAASLGAIAQDEPQTAITTWATLPPGPARDQAVDAIAKGWARQDPAAAAAWWATQDPARESTHKMPWETAEAIMGAWTARDADAALAWADARSAATNDVTPLYLWARKISERLPAPQAADQIARIRDITTQRQTLFNHVHPWLRSDPAAAEQWLTRQTHVSADIARAWIEEARKEATR